ncbi:hypothetical protein GCM10017687_35260 [Streptomyces echinatus]
MDENRTDENRTDENRTAEGQGGGPEAGGCPGAEPAEQTRRSDAETVAQPAGAPATGRPARPVAGRRSLRRRVLRFTTAVLALLLLPLLTAETALRLNYTGDPAPGTLTRHQDALWLGHAWVDGRKTGQDVKALARRLRDTGIRDLYVHSGPLEHDGTLPASDYPKARWLIAAVHRELPDVRVQAWLGDKLAGEGPDGLRLDRPATRTAVLASTRAILAAGFQGAHFDLEPLHSGDRDYLRLLDDLRELTHARGAVLSVAAHQIDPLPAFPLLLGHDHRPPQVVVAGVLRAGGPARGPDRRDVVRHHAAAAEPVRRLRGPADQSRPGGHPGRYRSADGPALLPREPVRPLGARREPSRPPCAASAWA